MDYCFDTSAFGAKNTASLHDADVHSLTKIRH
jgi:hypothetical protein